MNNLSNTAKKLDKVFEIAYIVLGALAIACIVGVALIGVAYILKLDPTMIGTGYENFDIGFLELAVAEGYAPSKWLILLQAAITLLVSCRLMYEGRRGVGYIREILLPMKEEKPFDTTLEIDCITRDGLLLDLATVMTTAHVRVKELTGKDMPGGHSVFTVRFEVKNTAELESIRNRLMSIRDVMGSRRGQN